MATVKKINKFRKVNIISTFWFIFISFSQKPRNSGRGRLNIKHMFHSFLQLLLASSDIYVYLFIFIFIFCLYLYLYMANYARNASTKASTSSSSARYFVSIFNNSRKISTSFSWTPRDRNMQKSVRYSNPFLMYTHIYRVLIDARSI